MTARIEVQREARRGDTIEVRIVIQHPMETGFRYDSLGRQTPRNVIHRFECSYGGAEVFRASMGAGIAANPYLRFFVAPSGRATSSAAGSIRKTLRDTRVRG